MKKRVITNTDILKPVFPYFLEVETAEQLYLARTIGLQIVELPSKDSYTRTVPYQCVPKGSLD